MKFHSLKNLFDSFNCVIRRFPFEMLFASISFVANNVRFDADHNKKIREITFINGMYLIKRK